MHIGMEADAMGEHQYTADIGDLLPFNYAK